MAMDFIFYYDDWDGCKVDLYKVVGLIGDDSAYNTTINMGTRTVNNRKVSFPVEPMDRFAIRMRSSSNIYLRSGIRGFESGLIDEENLSAWAKWIR